MAEVERTASATDLVAQIDQNPELLEKVKQDPVGALQGIATPLESDKWVYRIVVLALGLTVLIVVSGTFVLKVVDNQTPIPDALVAIGSGAVGALAGLLAPFPGGK